MSGAPRHPQPDGRWISDRPFIGPFRLVATTGAQPALFRCCLLVVGPIFDSELNHPGMDCYKGLNDTGASSLAIWRQFWSILDAYLLRLFDGEDAALLRQIAHHLPPDERDIADRNVPAR